MSAKKLVFAPLFLALFAGTSYQINALLNSSTLIFSLSINGLIEMILTAVLLLLSSLFFIIFATLARSWLIVCLISMVAATLPIFFLNTPLNYIYASGSFASFLLTNILLNHTLKTYLSFQPFKLFTTPTKNLTRLLILLIAICFYIQLSTEIKEKGFQIPDEVLDPVISTLSNQMVLGESITQAPSLPNLTSEQIELLRNNPDLLRQYGVDPKVFDSLYPAKSPTTPTSSPKHTNTIKSSPQSDIKKEMPSVPTQNDLVKTLVKNQIESSIKPYENYIAPVLAVLSFFALTSMVSLLSVFIGPLAVLIFFILEKTKFITFTQEMRPVKKLV